MFLFDLHCDTAFRCFTENKVLRDNSLSVNETDARVFEKLFETFAFYIPEKTENPFEFYKKMKNDFLNKLALSNQANLYPLFSVENGALIENDLDRISFLKEDNIKMLTLTWNNENSIAGGAFSDAGLKPFGKEVITKLNKNGIFCDLSHLNRKSFYETIELAERVVVTHSCLFEICPHKRNITLEMASLVADKGGLIGLCLYPEFLSKKDFLENFYKNIFLCLENGLENSIAIGSDFDGCDIPFKIGFIPSLYEFLQFKGLNTDILDKLFFYNAYNVFLSEE